MKNFRKRITINPEIHFGKPYVVGTRIIENIKACMQYALQLIREEAIYAKTD